jgi:hypothetical protein
VLGKLVSQLAPTVLDTPAITITAGDATHPGQILGNGDGQTNITTVRPNAMAVLTSQSGIGAADVPVLVDVPAISATAVTGDIHIYGFGRLRVPTVSAPGIIDVSAESGIVFEHVKGDALTFKSDGPIDIEDAQVTTSLTIIGTDITGSVSQTPGAPGPLYVSISGPNGTPANNAVIVIDPAMTVMPVLSAVDVTLTNIGPSFTILNGFVTGQMTLNMLGETYIMNNRSPVPLGWPAVQLYDNGGFFFSQNNSYTYFSGFIVDYNRFADVTALNGFDGVSLVRNLPLVDWDGGPFDTEPDNHKLYRGFNRLGLSPGTAIDAFQMPKVIEVIGNGPAVNLQGLQ